jgi:glycosyltransferase involved in cell wall biosynthesis
MDEEISWAEKINQKFVPRSHPSPFLFTIVIPVFNCSDKLLVTLESIKRQKYSILEVIVIDAGSSDRTLEIARSFFPLVTRIYSVTKYNLFEMINRGISLAGGRYITILMPGSYYLSDDALSFVALTALTNREPELITCGSIQRERGRGPRYFHYPFEQSLMAQGVQPATLSACFFASDLFDKAGTFSKKFSLRGGFEFLCRISRHKDLDVLTLDRVFVDFDFGAFTYGKFAHYASDTWRILNLHFGFWKAFVWFLGLSHLHLIRWMVGYFKRKLTHISSN